MFRFPSLCGPLVFDEVCFYWFLSRSSLAFFCFCRDYFTSISCFVFFTTFRRNFLFAFVVTPIPFPCYLVRHACLLLCHLSLIHAICELCSYFMSLCDIYVLKCYISYLHLFYFLSLTLFMACWSVTPFFTKALAFLLQVRSAPHFLFFVAFVSSSSVFGPVASLFTVGRFSYLLHACSLSGVSDDISLYFAELLTCRRSWLKLPSSFLK